MKIRMLTIAAGSKVNFSQGQVLKVGRDIDKETAKAFLGSRAATEVSDVETAEAASGETAEAPGSKKKGDNMKKDAFESVVAEFKAEHGEEVLANLLNDVKPGKVKAADRHTVANVLANYKGGE